VEGAGLLELRGQGGQLLALGAGPFAPGNHELRLEVAGGFEIVDKMLRREIFLGGSDAARFRAGVRALIASQPVIEDLDNFLAGYTGVMNTPVALH